MKRNFFIILTILLIISAIVGCTVYNYRQTQANIAQYNKQYESWYNKPNCLKNNTVAEGIFFWLRYLKLKN